MKYLLTGGGTGGHVYPALAVADDIRRREPDADILYVGVRGGLEARAVPARGYPLRFVRSRPLPRSPSPFGMLTFAASLLIGTATGVGILLRFRPHIIFATGGFASAPIMFAFGLLRKLGLGRAKVFLYEPNLQPGVLNHAVGRLADRVGVAFEEAGRWFDMKRVAVVGYPARRELLKIDRDASRHRLRIEEDCQVVLITGGSSGSRIINEAVVEALPLVRQRDGILVIHVTGRYSSAEYDAVRDTERLLEQAGLTGDTAAWYRRLDYSDDIQELYAAADVVVCRGGAGTLTEVCLCGLPAIVVPLAAAEDHQAANARELERIGAARVLYQGARWDGHTVRPHLDGELLAGEIGRLMDSPELRQRLSSTASTVPKRNSLELIASEIAALMDGRRPPPLSLEFPSRTKGVPSDPNALLRQVRQRLEEVGGGERLDPRELAYWRYQADRYLTSEQWYEIPLGKRNVGIKLVGLLGYQERLDLLLDMLMDRSRANGARRLFGGDFRHPGIVRRNVIEHGLHNLDEMADRVEEVLVRALETDPYFEVRAAAARALGDRNAIEDTTNATLLTALTDRSPRVVIQALRAVGRVGRGGDELLGALRRFYIHPDSQFRQEVVRALGYLLHRGVLSAEDLDEDVDQILATSSGFEPAFPLKESLGKLAEQVRSSRPPRRAGTGER